MRKNVAGQAIVFNMLDADGDPVTTGTPTVYVTKDNGTQATGSGTSAHKGNGDWSYVPAQAETNANHVSFKMTLTDAIPQTLNVYPVAYDPTDAVSLGLSNLDAKVSTRSTFDHTQHEVTTNAASRNASKADVSGLSTFNPATDKVTVQANEDKSGYSIAGTKTTLDALQDLSQAQAQAAALAALNSYDPPTKAELDAVVSDLQGWIEDLQFNTRVDIVLPRVMERPDEGEGPIAYQLWINLYDSTGSMEVPDSTPTISAANQSGSDRSANLGSVTSVSDGRYSVTYTVDDSHAMEQVVFTVEVVEGGKTRTYNRVAIVMDTTAVDYTATDRLRDNAIKSAIDSYLDAAISSRLAASSYAAPPTPEQNAGAVRTELSTELGRLDTTISSRLATTSYTTPPTTGAIASQVRTELATELAHLDTDISSRLASSSYTAPPTAEAISTQVAADLEEAHGVGSWTTADTSGLSTLDGSAVYSAALAALDEYEPLPAGDYTAPDNAGIAAIKSQTDQLAFTGSDVKATLDGEKVTPIDVDGLTHASAVEAMLAVLLGKATVTDHGATRTATYTKQDGTTAKVTVTFDGDGNRTASTVS